MSFENNIKTWITYDNEIKELNNKLKKLREQKNNLTNDIFNYANEKNIINKNIKINDGNLRFTTVKVTSPLTFKFITNCLSEIINNPEQVKQIIDYLKEKRENKYVEEIKRFYS